MRDSSRDAAAVPHGDAADAVELALEDPGRIAEAGIRELGPHGVGARRRRARVQQRPLVVFEKIECAHRVSCTKRGPPSSVTMLSMPRRRPDNLYAASVAIAVSRIVITT